MNIFWRISHALYSRGGTRYLARLFELLSYLIGSNAISAKASIGEGTKFYHRGVGCIVHFNTVIGKECTIFANVTLGSKWSDGLCKGEAPTVGDRVMIGTGSVIVGNITIGDDSIIGANAVVTKNVPENSIALGVPATIASRN